MFHFYKTNTPAYFTLIHLKSWFLNYVTDCMLPFIFATLDTNAGEVEGEEFGEGCEEDQWLANQGKPSIDLWLLCLILMSPCGNHCLLILCALVSLSCQFMLVLSMMIFLVVP